MAIDKCRMIDDEYFSVGNSDDCKWYHSGGTTYFDNITGAMYFRNQAHGTNVLFQTETAAGAVKTMLTFDPDVSTDGAVNLPADNLQLRIGTHFDITAYHDGSDSYFTNLTGDLYFKNYSHGDDIIFTAETVGGVEKVIMTLDPDTGEGSMHLGDTCYMILGADTDSYIYHDGTDFSAVNDNGDLIIRNKATIGDGDISIQNKAHGYDTEFTNENAGGVAKTLLTLDPDEEGAIVNDGYIGILAPDS